MLVPNECDGLGEVVTGGGNLAAYECRVVRALTRDAVVIEHQPRDVNFDAALGCADIEEAREGQASCRAVRSRTDHEKLPCG